MRSVLFLFANIVLFIFLLGFWCTVAKIYKNIYIKRFQKKCLMYPIVFNASVIYNKKPHGILSTKVIVNKDSIIIVDQGCLICEFTFIKITKKFDFLLYSGIHIENQFKDKLTIYCLATNDLIRILYH